MHVTGLEPLVALWGTFPDVTLAVVLVVATFAAFTLVVLATAILTMAIVFVALLHGVGPFGPVLLAK